VLRVATKKQKKETLVKDPDGIFLTFKNSNDGVFPAKNVSTVILQYGTFHIEALLK